MPIRAAHLLALLLGVAMAVEAQSYEAVVMGAHQDCNIHRENTTHQRTVEWMNPDQIERDTAVRRIASNQSGRVFALVGSQPYQISVITPRGGHTLLAVASGTGLSIAVADDGRIYVHSFREGHRIDRFSPAGVLEASYPIDQPHGIGIGFDVAADGCTVFYTSSAGRDYIGNVIQRINGCTGERLPDFAGVEPPVEDLEVQPDGQLLVTTRRDVRFYSAAGVLVRTVVPGLEAYGFDPRYFIVEQASVRDGELWLTANDPCGQGNLLRVDFASGAERSRRPLGTINVAYDLIVGSAPVPTVPTAGEVALALLAAVLAAAGALVLRLR